MADVISFGPDRPSRPPPRWLTVVGAVVLCAAGIVAAAVVVFRDHSAPMPAMPTPPTPSPTPAGTRCVPLGWAQEPPVADPVAGLVIEAPVPDAGAARAVESCDRTATAGPWTVTVRRRDGTLGRHGAVVTFPVAPVTTGRAVRVGSTTGRAHRGAVTWPVGGTYARVRGDLAETVLLAIASGTTVTAGRPAVRPPVGYTVVASGPYRPPAVHSVRYGSAELGEQVALGAGLAYTGVCSGGGFEDRLYAVPADDGGLVDGRHAVVSRVLGGSATLAWEPTPGVVAFVGYSGAELDGEATAALRRLAGRARPLAAADWRALRPEVVDQVNDPG